MELTSIAGALILFGCLVGLLILVAAPIVLVLFILGCVLKLVLFVLFLPFRLIGAVLGLGFSALGFFVKSALVLAGLGFLLLGALPFLLIAAGFCLVFRVMRSRPTPAAPLGSSPRS